MSKCYRLFLCLILRLKDGHKAVFLPATSPFYVIWLLTLWRFGGRARVFQMLCPCVVPETVIQWLSPLETFRGPPTSCRRKLREWKHLGY